METSLWFQVIGGILGLVSSVGFIVVSFLVKGWLAENQRLAEEREQRYQDRFEGLQKEIARVERTGIVDAKETAQALSKLPDQFVPRKEMEAIIKRIEAGNETTLTYLRKMDGQVDRLTQLFLTQTPKEDGKG